MMIPALEEVALFAWYIGVLVLLEGLLSADNALVLAVMVRHLPKNQQRRVLFWGIWAQSGSAFWPSYSRRFSCIFGSAKSSEAATFSIWRSLTLFDAGSLRPTPAKICPQYPAVGSAAFGER